MAVVKIVPDISIIPTFHEFAEQTVITDRDLLITSRPVYQNLSGKDKLPWRVVLQEDFGSGEPSVALVERIFESLKGFEFQRVIAIGGGSVLDISKLFALKRISPVRDVLFQRIKPEKARKLILVPTTCGTGSEVTNISIIGLKAEGVKFGLAADALYADRAVLIPQLLETLPFSIFGASSIDALIHASESYLSPKANAFTRVYAREAIRTILGGYQRIAAASEDARLPLLESFQLASAMAGLSFGTAGNGIVHGLSHWLGAARHIPHGEATYAFFIPSLRAYEAKGGGEMLESLLTLYAEALRADRAAVFERLEALLDRIVSKKTLKGYGIERGELAASAKAVWDTQQRLLANSYVPLNESDILEILEAVYE